MILAVEVYNEILKKIDAFKSHDFRYLEKQLADDFNIPICTITSIVSNEFTKKMKKTYFKLNSRGEQVFEQFMAQVAAGHKPGIIRRLAETLDIASSLVAKMIVTKFYEKKKGVAAESPNVKLLMKDPSLIEDKELAYEVYLCSLYDEKYGNITDSIKHSIGHEYEFKLRRVLDSRNMTFQSEEELRQFGYDKTPDVKLDKPVAVDGFVVNWIESKALFGGPDVHRGYIRDQYASYWNRFGSGMVIYWLGFVETIQDPSEKRFIVRLEIPTDMVHMDPLSIAQGPREDGVQKS